MQAQDLLATGFLLIENTHTPLGGEIKAHTSSSLTFEPLPFTSNTRKEGRLN